MSKSDSEPDLLDSLIRRVQDKDADRLERQMQEAEHIKAKEEQDSQGRLEQMWVQEHERQRALAESRAEQRRQEQQMMRYALIAAAVLILVIVLVALVLTGLGGDSAPESLPLLLQAYA